MSRPSPKPKISLHYDPDQVLRHARIVLASGKGCVEIRVLEADLDNRNNIIPGGRFQKTIAGWFDDPNELLEEVRRIRGVSAYVTANPVTRDLLARVGNRLAICKSTTTDANIVGLCHWFIDFDPKRPTGISSTEAERTAAVARRDKFLVENPEIRAASYWGTSGNGTFLLVRLPGYPNDPEHAGLVARATEIVVKRYSDDQVELDTSVKNPARIMALAGTMKCKGEDLPDRPYRMAMIEGPGGEPATLDLKAWLAGQPEDAGASKPAEPKGKPADKGKGRPKATPANTLERARKFVFAMKNSVEGEKGHNQLYGVAVALVDGFGLEEEDAITILTDWNALKAKPPESAKQVAHKIAQAIKNYPSPSKQHLNAPFQPDADDGPRAERSEGGSVGFVGAFPQVNPDFSGRPRPLQGELLAVHPLPHSLIPDPLRGWLVDIAQRGSFPLEYPVAAALTSISSLLGRNLTIRPKRRDTWTVVPNLWGAIVGPPGLQKTPAVEEVFLPLKRLVAEAMEAHEEAEKRAVEDASIAEARASSAKIRLREAVKKNLPEVELRRLAAEATGSTEKDPPTLKRYMINDATVEKAGELLRENPRGFLQFRDELGGFFRAMDKQGHESDRGFYLETWTGNGAYTFDRIGRGTVHIKALCLSVFGTIQPGPLARYLKGAASGEDADGFMPRFQVLVYPDAPEKFVNNDQWPDKEAKNQAFHVFKWIDSIDPKRMGIEEDEDRGLHFLKFDDDAQDLFDEWRCTLENRLRDGSESTMMACHLAKYRSLMPSLALIFHAINSVGQERLGPVTRAAAEVAAAWCDFLEAHARRIYQYAIEGDPEIAVRMGERIRQSLPNPFTFRQVANKGWSGLDSVDDVRRAVGILEDRNWVKVVTKPAGPAGGRPSEEVWINPAVYGSEDQP
jgi:hypothetical protein